MNTQVMKYKKKLNQCWMYLVGIQVDGCHNPGVMFYLPFEFDPQGSLGILKFWKSQMSSQDTRVILSS